MTDHIIQGCIKNDARSQRALYDKYSGQMYGICLRYCKDENTAIEAMQDGFIKIFKYIQNYRSEGAIDAWMRKIIVRASLDQMRKRKKLKFSELEHIDETQHSYHLKTDLDNMGYNQMLKLLDNLSEGYKLIFTMYVLDEMSHAEIAQELNITESTSRSQLYKARKQLQSLILERKHLLS